MPGGISENSRIQTPGTTALGLLHDQEGIEVDSRVPDRASVADLDRVRPARAPGTLEEHATDR
jgi:hypothetical protein